VGSRTAKAYKQAVTENDGKTVILRPELELAVEVTNALRQTGTAAGALQGSEREVSIYWESDTGLPLKCRPDAWRRDIGLVADLKTTTDASPEAFARAVERYHYDLSAALYMRGVEAVTGERPRYAIRSVLCV